MTAVSSTVSGSARRRLRRPRAADSGRSVPRPAAVSRLAGLGRRGVAHDLGAPRRRALRCGAEVPRERASARCARCGRLRIGRTCPPCRRCGSAPRRAAAAVRRTRAAGALVARARLARLGRLGRGSPRVVAAGLRVVAAWWCGRAGVDVAVLASRRRLAVRDRGGSRRLRPVSSRSVRVAARRASRRSRLPWVRRLPPRPAALCAEPGGRRARPASRRRSSGVARGRLVQSVGVAGRRDGLRAAARQRRGRRPARGRLGAARQRRRRRVRPREPASGVVASTGGCARGRAGRPDSRSCERLRRRGRLGRALVVRVWESLHRTHPANVPTPLRQPDDQMTALPVNPLSSDDHDPGTPSP